MTNLKQAAMETYKRAEGRLSAGHIPTALGLHGLAAIMHNQITRFFDAGNKEEILNLGADALVLASMVIDEELEADKGIIQEMGEDALEQPEALSCPWCSQWGILAKPSIAEVEVCQACWENRDRSEYEAWMETLADDAEEPEDAPES